MPVITKISVQQKRKDRYNIFMDYGKGEQYAFSADEDVIIKFGLKKGMELDALSLTQIEFQDEIRKAYNQAIHYLSRRMRSETEVRKHLAEKETDESIINEVIVKLYEYKFLNDNEFAIAYVRTQANTSDKGLDVIKRELKEKGISQPDIEEAIQEFPVEDQVEAAVKLCQKYAKKYSRESQRLLKQKLEQMLLRKGYPFSVINIAVEEAEFEEDDDGELDAIRYQGEKAHRKYEKLQGYEYKQKMKQALFRKGFPIELIDRFLEEKEEEE